MPAASQEQTTTKKNTAKSKTTSRAKPQSGPQAKLSARATKHLNDKKATSISKKPAAQRRTKTPRKAKATVPKVEMNGSENEHSAEGQETVLMSAVFSKVVALMSLSQFHKHSFISDLEWLVAPALLNGQYKVWEKSGVPIAYVSWANINSDVEKRFAEGGVKLKPVEWNSGPSPWIVDVICPGANPKPFLQEIVREHFAENGVKTIAPDDEGNRRVVLLKVSDDTQRENVK